VWIYKREGSSPGTGIEILPVGWQHYSNSAARAMRRRLLLMLYSNIAARENPRLDLVAYATRLDDDRGFTPQRVRDADDSLECVALRTAGSRTILCLIRGPGVVIEDASDDFRRDARTVVRDGNDDVAANHAGLYAHLWRYAGRLTRI
jgi:hypothetical protein